MATVAYYRKKPKHKLAPWCRYKKRKLKVQKPLRKVSPRMAKRLKEYVKLRRAYLQWVELCEVCLRDKPTEIHHTRGRIGKNLCDSLTFLAVCAQCHRYIHDHPKWSMAHGYMKSRLEHEIKDLPY